MASSPSSASHTDSYADSNILIEDRLQGRPLTNIQTTLIKPSTPTPKEKEWLTLSALDYLWVSYYTPILSTYTNVEAGPFVERLKASLAEALVWFYPLAGRVLGIQGKEGERPRVHCNDAGAVFTEAWVDAELSSLLGLSRDEAEDFQPVKGLSGLESAGLVDYPVLPKLEGGLPGLVVQVTHFKCGGITLATNWAHAIADGQAGFHFLKSWSELARSLPLSVLPDHNRIFVLPSEHTPSSPPPPNPFVTSSFLSPQAQLVQNSPLPNPPPQNSQPPQNAQNPSPPNPSPPPKPIVPKAIAFTKTHITTLKHLAVGSDDHPTKPLSRADCLSTHLWRSVAIAQNLQPTPNPNPNPIFLRLCLLVEGRKALSLPQGYFGNVVNMLPVITSFDELVNQPFGNTARLIHDAIRANVTKEWYQQLAEYMPSVFGKKFETVNPMQHEKFPEVATIGVSYLVRFPFYELDFGFGRPEFSMRNTMGARDGLFFVVPSADEEGMVVLANTDSDVMSKFVEAFREI